MRPFHRSLAWLSALLALSLAACSSTPGVRVSEARPVWLPSDARVQVSGEDPDARWAAEKALADRDWVGAGATLTLRTYVTVATEARVDRDPFCDPYGWRPHGWHPRAYWGGFHGSCSPWGPRWEAYPVRTVTWALEDANGQLLWYASARELRPTGPPLAPARRLAQALAVWREAPTR